MTYPGETVVTETRSFQSLRDIVLRHLEYTVGTPAEQASITEWRIALTLAVREFVAPQWLETQQKKRTENHKQVYYLSMEFLIGRLLDDALINLHVRAEAANTLAAYGVSLEAVLGDEPDAALGNGGLGRLAACYLESMSTVGCAGTGYGIRFEHGLFRQSFSDGQQHESAEDWLGRDYWQAARPSHQHRLKFGGHVTETGVWEPAETVIAAAYDVPAVGWKGEWINTLRLWAPQSPTALDLGRFNGGDLIGASEPELRARALGRVLYPDDSTAVGLELRLRQEYFLVAASIADIWQEFVSSGRPIASLPDHVAIQLNDTHPTIAGPELLRLLIDENGIDWDTALDLVTRTLAYTNHTLLPEALEQWSVDLMRHVLPRHLQIIEQLDAWHADQFADRSPTVAVVADGTIRMGNLAFILAHHINGVSELHTDLVASELFTELDKMHPGRIINQTNGVTPRRWIATANPTLAQLITDTIGTGWQADLDRLTELETYAGDPGFHHAFGQTKAANKQRFARWLQQTTGQHIGTEALFDVQAKRLHEYKRQLLNIIATATHYQRITADPNADWVPRVKIFAGKAAPGYAVAKDIIRLINDVASVVNNDPVTKDRLTVVFPPNYNVSMAELLIPAADLSEQISTAGMEASGTGNMKFALNGALTIGTLDGANVEIRERVGPENFFLFGLTADEVSGRRAVHDHAALAIEADPALAETLDQIAGGRFNPSEPDRYRGLIDGLRHHDYFLVTDDFGDYDTTQQQVDAAFMQTDTWQQSAILNTARTGYFSSDRAIRGYQRDIWATGP